MGFEFTEAVPVTRAGGPGPGRKPSPFEAPVKSIAGVTVEVEVDGKKVVKPKALQFVIPTVDMSEIKKFRGQLQSMGKRCDPEVTVYVDDSPEMKDVKGKKTPTGNTVITFWTTPKIRRTRKPKTTEATPTA